MATQKNRRTPYSFALARLFLSTAVVSAPALAEEPPNSPPLIPGWQFNAASFLWAPSVTGNVTVRGRGFTDNASFTDIIQKSDSVFGYMGHFEAQHDRIGLFLEPIWMRLGFSTSDILHGKTTANLTYVEAGGFYRVFQGVTSPTPHDWSLDALIGVRYTDLSVSTSFAAGPTPSQSKNWADPFLGARLRISMAPGWDLQLRGDVGGFGAGSEFSWNFVGLVGYRFSLFGAAAEAFGGYKALYQDYRSDSGNRAFKWDNILWGPVLGLNISF